MLVSIFVLLLLLLCRTVAALVVVRRDRRAHGIHRAHSTVSDRGMGVTVALWWVWWQSYKDKWADVELITLASEKKWALLWNIVMDGVSINTHQFNCPITALIPFSSKEAMTQSCVGLWWQFSTWNSLKQSTTLCRICKKTVPAKSGNHKHTIKYNQTMKEEILEVGVVQSKSKQIYTIWQEEEITD